MKVVNNHKYINGVFAFSLLWLLTACGGVSSIKAGAIHKDLDAAVVLYHQAMRWGKWNSLVRLIRPKPDAVIEPMNLYAVDLEYYESLRVMKVEMGESSFDPIKLEAATPVRIEYMQDYSNRVQKHTMMLYWWYDEESKIWFTETPLPKLSGKTS